ncbi:MAG: sigma-70 family RNA polymerase sigma factor [Gammaproteobacteria bacterium]|nr:sigma-70 family RNA polymerase sigma factor [Gammaproteobacteria bacterium]
MVQKAQDYYPLCPEVLLITLARDGDQKAFRELIHRYQSRIRNLMQRLCSQEHLADDLAQQVFVKLWQKLKYIRDVNAFTGWVRKIAVNIWLQHVRKHDLLKISEQISGTEAQTKETPCLGMDLQSALEQLSANMRLCVVLSYQEGMSHSEISEITKIPLGTVKSNIKRGGEQLKQLLSDYQTN